MTCDICNDDQFPAEIVNDKLVCTRCKASTSFAAPGLLGGNSKPQYRRQILDMLLANGPMTDRQIADRLGVTIWKAQTQLCSAVKSKKVAKLTKPYEKPARYAATCPICRDARMIQNKRGTWDECPSCYVPPNADISDQADTKGNNANG